MNQQNKYNKIINAAIQVITEQGFEDTSVSQIVRRAGVAQGTFYLYFQSKKELVPAIAQMILSDQLDRIQNRYGNTRSLDELLDVLIDVTYEITAEYKELIMFCYSGLAYYYSFERWEEIYRPYYLWLENRLQELHKGSNVKFNNSLKYLANFTINLIEHGAESFYLSGVDNGEVCIKSELKYFLKNAISTS
ncbi:TetR family transcriptional regulator [Natranaerobius trueperi]|uniref:TetR family transcriptional regulator n=1 Tax=Natranaerobius trueperi TaxID=759412 RepID=A0A226BZK0_9FIRM|nr:TetR family transcriptional regulator [Natranaerobius trueperi]OWZ84351.1 TetR family transcriptional regulator [Natranaerobius trueperi]